MARAGDYKEQIGIYVTEFTGIDELGSSQATDALYWKTQAKVEPMKGTRGLEAGQIVNGQAYKMWLRYRSDKQANGSMFIKWRGKVLQIHSVVNVNASNTELEILAFEGYNHDIVQAD